MRVVSVNIGVARSNDWDVKLAVTGIDKRPVPGPVAVTAPGPIGSGKVGLAGDRVYDLKHHGGDDAAVYAYAREDYDFWQPRMERDLPNGVFGENLTTSGLDVSGALIGERWRIGELVLQVTSPRIPCQTFRGWIDQKGWLKTFTDAARPGTYLRVLSPGEISPGETIVVESRPDHDVTVAEMFRAVTTDRSLLPRFLTAAEMPESYKDMAREYLAAQ